MGNGKQQPKAEMAIISTHTNLTASDIQPLLGSTLTRIKALLTPLCPALSHQESPSEADISAAATTLRQCDNLLTELESLATSHDMKSGSWPTYNQWCNFADTLLDYASGIETTDFKTSLDSLLATVKRMRLKSRMPLSDGGRLFRSTELRKLLGEVAGRLYSEFIDRQQLKHKEVMVRLATIYEIIRRQAGVGKTFLGPDFDDLFITTLGIRYNSSANRRGRYRSVEDAYNRLFRDSDSGLHSPEFRDMLHAANRLLSGIS